ncbi:MAG: acetoacetyl-CoA synthetase / long-chain-fatty-acid--CoA ligase [Verrucomicrobiales bacterium]|nr:acetoacetyl-CoA synthetase / long-chain-fatty-acid--CoA ligase [Verrucomicrobiales bacterium]
MNLSEAFAECATAQGAKHAIYYGSEELTYAELYQQCQQFAGFLNGQVRAQDRVGIWLKNCPEFVSVVFAILNLEAVVVPINNFLKADEVSRIVQDAGIKLIITDDDLDHEIGKLREMAPHLEMIKLPVLKSNTDGTLSRVSSARENDLAVMIYTSGTTGKAKGVMLSHGNLLANVESCRVVLRAAGTDRFIVLLPLFHSFMMCVGMFLPLLVGGAMILIKSIHPAKNVLAEIMHRGGTILPSVPQFFRTLANVTFPPNFPLRLCISGGAPLPGEILREWNANFPIPLLEGYGLSEASPVVSFNPLLGPWKAGSIGVPITGVEISIQGENGEFLGDHETGEVCVRGANVMLGYWNQPEETSRVMRGGWLLTGDIGHRDEEGYFYITDRKKDMLLVNGINVYPREIEETIYRFPGIREAAVVGEKSERRGEQPVGFISEKEGFVVDVKELVQFLKEHLADYKVPRKIKILPALPRNPTGKILKPALKEMLNAEKAED